ncbi:MAG: 1-(5-phosphoribosyl)-5-[(5-phosphoribosylamino) methylideneamino]imidazole-4-carboxamide isomerase [Candidatus Methylacidiphilales bacterium]
MGGQVVRLEQGRADRKTVYSDDPPAVAERWQQEGATWLHLVDLDAAFTGEPANLPVVKEILARLTIPVQLGGGIRSLEAAERALNAGVTRVILGSRACEEPAFVGQAVQAFGGTRIVVGIDARDGYVSTRGWTETSRIKAVDLARHIEAEGARTLVYTDIATDGMLRGPNLEAMTEMAAAVHLDVIASGGVSHTDDVRRLSEIPKLHGAILGKALYEGRTGIPECLAITR